MNMPKDEPSKSQMPSKFGIAFFQYDLIARIVPGLVSIAGALFLLAACHHERAASMWTTILKTESDWWVGTILSLALVIVAYVAGQTADGLVSWWVSDIFANIQNKLRNWAAGNCKGWSEFLTEYVRDHYDHPQSQEIGKAQVESRALANLAVILACLATTISVDAYYGAQLFPAPSNADVTSLVMPIFLFAAACLVNSYLRQGRRVWATRVLVARESPRKYASCMVEVLHSVMGLVAIGAALYSVAVGSRHFVHLVEAAWPAAPYTP